MNYPSTAGLGATAAQPSAMNEYVQRHTDLVSQFAQAADSVEGLLAKMRGPHSSEVGKQQQEPGISGFVGTLARQHELLTNYYRRLEKALAELHQII